MIPARCPEAHIAAQCICQTASARRAPSLKLLLDELTQTLCRRRCQFICPGSAELLKERPQDAYPSSSRGLCQPSGIEHVSIKTAQFLFDRVSLTLLENAGALKRGLQVVQCGAQLVTGPLYRLWAVAPRKVPVEKALNISVCQIGHGQMAVARSASEVRDPAQVHPCGVGRVSLIDEATPIRGYEGGQVTVSQPRGRHMMNTSNRIHAIS